MSWLVYVNGPDGPSARIIRASTAKGGPKFGKAEREAGVLATHALKRGEDILPLSVLTRRYPPPKSGGAAGSSDPAPTPETPRDGGVAREVEVAHG